MRAVVLTVVATLIGGCGSREPVRTFMVDGHTFEVPARHLLSNRVSWLPQLGRSSGFTFAVDPNGELGKKVLVTVEPKNVTCRLDKVAASPMLRRACSGEGLGPPDLARGDRVDRVHVDGDETQWTYVLTRGDSGAGKYSIAGCYLRDPKEQIGSCLSLGALSGRCLLGAVYRCGHRSPSRNPAER
jgi:hypothetical protein